MLSIDCASSGTIILPPLISPWPLSTGLPRVPRTVPRRSAVPSIRYSGGSTSPSQVADRVLWNPRWSGMSFAKPTVPWTASSFPVVGSAR